MLLAHQTSLGAALRIIDSRKMFRLSPPFSAEFLLIPPTEVVTARMQRSISLYHGEITDEPPHEELHIEEALGLEDPIEAVAPEIYYDQMTLIQAFPYEVEETELRARILPALDGFRQIGGFKNVGVVLLFRWAGAEGTIFTAARQNELQGNPEQIYHFFNTGYWYSRIDLLRTNRLELIGCLVEDPDTPGFLEKLSRENGAATFENPYLHREDLNRLLRTRRRFLEVSGEALVPYRGAVDTIRGRDVIRARRGRFPWSKPINLDSLGRLHLFANAD